MPRSSSMNGSDNDKMKKPSSSSASSLSSAAAATAMKNYRFTRGGSKTPVPVWSNSTSSNVSARKLANAMWEFSNDPPPPSDTNVSGRSKSASRRRMLLLTYDKETALAEKACPRSLVTRRKNYFKELQNGLMTSRELLKLIVRLCGGREQKGTVVSLASALYGQLDRVGEQVDRLFREERNDGGKDLEMAKIATQSVLEELSVERRLRRRAERLNKRLGSELAQMKSLVVKTTKELESERKTREIIERVCSEMVKDIGHDKAAVEEMKRESAKVLEDLEEERQMLQLADEWREERIHMKLSEAKFQFEEKNAAVDKLRNELELFLTAKRTDEIGEERDVGQNVEDGEDRHVYPVVSCLLADSLANGSEKSEEGLNDDAETDSEDSDLHSIELSMDSNNKGFVWSYAAGNVEHREELDIDHDKNDEISNYFDGVSRNFSGESGMTDGTEGDFLRGQLDFGGKFIEEFVDDSNLLVDDKDQILVQSGEQYEFVNGLNDRTLADSKTVVPRGLPSPIRQWEKSQASKCKGHHQPGEGSKIAELMKAIRESESKAALVRSRNEVHQQSQIGPVA